MTSSSLQPPSFLHPDSARRSPTPSPNSSTVSLSRVSTASSRHYSPSHYSPALSRTASAISSAPSLTRPKTRHALIARVSSHSRLSLKYQAQTWRFLEGIGVYMNSWPKPIPPEPAFTRYFQTSDFPSSAIELTFYVPVDYEKRKKEGKKYPLVLNFHGGGFTLGTTKDDARWAAFVLRDTPAIFVSVGYRLAPEFPFPNAVEDGVEALLHLSVNADAYAIDPQQIALTGFSAGGNLVFTVPIRLQDHLKEMRANLPPDVLDDPNIMPPSPRIVSIISFYPALDMRLSRAERRASCIRPDKTLPPILTDLFDESYLPDECAKLSPYASPPLASDGALKTALPDRVGFVLCEWDMLLKEGQDFADQLKGIGKSVNCEVVEKTRHAFDKAPCPFGIDPKVGHYYEVMSKVLSEAFETAGAVDTGKEV